MMWWFHDGGWWLWLMPIPMLVFWGLVIWAVVTVVGRAGESRGPAASGRDPERVLAERFARGEIDAAEYEQRLTTLRGHKTAA